MIDPKITCHGADGSVWRYFAIYGPDYAPEETGWVLVADDDTQRLTAPEVVGDIASEIVRVQTRAMLQMLQSRRLPDDPAERVALVMRIAELRRDLGELS